MNKKYLLLLFGLTLYLFAPVAVCAQQQDAAQSRGEIEALRQKLEEQEQKIERLQ